MRSYRGSFLIAAAAAFSLAVARPCAAQTQAPAVVDLGVLPGFDWSNAVAINASGQAVGTCSTTTQSDAQAFVWVNGVMTALPELRGSDTSTAMDINASGQIVGYCRSSRTQTNQACIWQLARGAWTVTALGVPAGYTEAEAWFINDAGDVAGQAYNSTSAAGFHWDSVSKMTLLQDPAGNPIYPCQMNASGQIVGRCSFGSSSAYPAVWDRGTVTGIDAPDVQVASVNDQGLVVGYCTDSGAPSGYRSFLYIPTDAYGWTAGTYTGIADSMGWYHAINNAGQIAIEDGAVIMVRDLPTNCTAGTGDPLPGPVDRGYAPVINGSGAVVAVCTDQASGGLASVYFHHDFVTGSSICWTLGGLGGAAVVANDLSDSGGVAGWSLRADGTTRRACVWGVEVTPAPLAVTVTSTARKGGTVIVTVAIKNTGTAAAENVLLDAARLQPLDAQGGPAGDPVYSYTPPVSLRTIGAGATKTCVLKFTGASVPPGSYSLYVQGTCSLGALSSGPALVSVP